VAGGLEKQARHLPVFIHSGSIFPGQNYLNHCLDLMQTEARLYLKVKGRVIHPAF
jgi:hypothetical protein